MRTSERGREHSDASLEPPPMFTNESFSLVETITRSRAGDPGRCIFLKKKGAVSTATFWECEFDGEFKTCLTPINRRKSTVPRKSPLARKEPRSQHPVTRNPPSTDEAPGSSSDDTQDELSETEAFSENERPDDLEFWFRDEDECVFRSRRADPATENVERPRMQSSEIFTLYGMASDVVDDTKYYMTVNSLTSVLTVTWKQSERGLHWGKFVTSKRIIDAARGKKFHASCSSSLSIHSYDECIARAKRWCVWHSTWIYDIRPIEPFARTNWLVCVYCTIFSCIFATIFNYI